MADDAHNPLPLSVSIVCMNNEATIERTIESVRAFAAEIIAVDSGSTDATIGILEQAGARVVDQEWLGHVKQKQHALELCTQPWILHLDSDESVEPELASSIRAALAADDPAIQAYSLNRRVWWAGRMLNHAWQPEWRTRLVRRGCARWGGYDPHDKLDTIDAGARTERLTGILRHDSIPSITAFLSRQASHARIAAASYEAMGRRGSVASLITSPIGAWLKQVVLRSAWRDGWRGWVAASATAAAAMMKHAALLERTRGKDAA
jgi:GTP:adenosylcobinamide-phosphate guanylyltransferase